MNTFDLNVGDWSNDGHGHNNAIPLQSNATKDEIMEAYLASCKKLGLALHKGLPGTTALFCDYDESNLSADQLNTLIGFGFDSGLLDQPPYDEEEDVTCCVDDVVELFIFFVQLSDPDIELERAPEENFHLNGFWDKKYNFSMGYGVTGEY
jgi:hypothetical protein